MLQAANWLKSSRPVKFHVYRSVYLQPEILYAKQGIIGKRSHTYGTEEGTMSLDYIHVPLLIKVEVFKSGRYSMDVFSGPSLAKLINHHFEHRYDWTTRSGKTDYNPKTLTYER